jgi:hypothetical protein
MASKLKAWNGWQTVGVHSHFVQISDAPFRQYSINEMTPSLFWKPVLFLHFLGVKGYCSKRSLGIEHRGRFREYGTEGRRSTLKQGSDSTILDISGGYHSSFP